MTDTDADSHGTLDDETLEAVVAEILERLENRLAERFGEQARELTEQNVRVVDLAEEVVSRTDELEARVAALERGDQADCTDEQEERLRGIQ